MTHDISYTVIMTCRDGEKTVRNAVLSWIEQTIMPRKIIVINDGSTDNSLQELEKFRHIVKIINFEKSEYDVKRIPINWNIGLSEGGLLTDYHVIATEDSIPQFDYSYKILNYMAKQPDVFACSGVIRNSKAKLKAPTGIGRFINNKIFKTLTWRGFYPYQCGYESAVLYDANRLGYSNKITEYAVIEHIRQLGQNHGFKEWPIACKLLGFSWQYTTARLFLMVNRRMLSFAKALQLSNDYLRFKPKPDGYFSLYRPELRQYIKQKVEKQWMKLIVK